MRSEEPGRELKKKQQQQKSFRKPDPRRTRTRTRGQLAVCGNPGIEPETLEGRRGCHVADAPVQTGLVVVELTEALRLYL